MPSEDNKMFFGVKAVDQQKLNNISMWEEKMHTNTHTHTKEGPQELVKLCPIKFKTLNNHYKFYDYHKPLRTFSCGPCQYPSEIYNIR